MFSRRRVDGQSCGEMYESALTLVELHSWREEGETRTTSTDER